VLARRRLRESRKQAQQQQQSQRLGKSSGNGATKRKAGKEKEKDPTGQGEKAETTMNGVGQADAPSPANTATLTPPLSNTLPPREQIERQTPVALALAVRKHFNAQQLNEAETVARFIYVARHGASRGVVKTEGADGSGNGFVMGSMGREIRCGDGGEVGFRLRFRP
jgi:hypothetical protein